MSTKKKRKKRKRAYADSCFIRVNLLSPRLSHLYSVVIHTGKRAAETTGQQLDQSHRFRIVVLQPPARVHIHTVKVLQESGSNSRSAVRHADRYVESGLHLGRALHRISTVSGRGRDRTACLHHGSLGSAARAHYQSCVSSQTLLR